MSDDVEGLVAEMKRHNIACGSVQDQGWGLLTQVTLPGGGKLGIYQPRHARPKATSAPKAAKKPARRATNRPSTERDRTIARKKARRR
jgi:hypothetical protein